MSMPVTRVASLLLLTVLSACGGSSSPMSDPNPPPPPPTGGNPPPPPSTHTDVLTYKNDISRTGQNLTETQLTLANVNSSSFGRLRTLATDGKVDAQPLYAGGVTVQGASHNVVFVATENDSVYAFDADSGAILWQVSLLGSGEVPSDTHSCGQVSPMIGITADAGHRPRGRGPRHHVCGGHVQDQRLAGRLLPAPARPGHDHGRGAARRAYDHHRHLSDDGRHGHLRARRSTRSARRCSCRRARCI